MAIGRDEKGRKLTNVEIIRTAYAAGKRLKEATPAEYGEKQAKRMHEDYVHIFGMTPQGADPVAADRCFAFYEQIANAPDYDTANKLYMDNIYGNNFN